MGRDYGNATWEQNHDQLFEVSGCARVTEFMWKADNNHWNLGGDKWLQKL